MIRTEGNIPDRKDALLEAANLYNRASSLSARSDPEQAALFQASIAAALIAIAAEIRAGITTYTMEP